MRLSAEVLDHIKKWYAKCEEADCMPENGLTIGRLLDTIEALQQENEQLRAQVARMRELLVKAYDEIEKYKCLWKGSKPSGCDCPKPTVLQDEIEQALAAIDKAIGGGDVDKG